MPEKWYLAQEEQQHKLRTVSFLLHSNFYKLITILCSRGLITVNYSKLLIVPSDLLVDEFTDMVRRTEAVSIDVLLYAGSPRGYPQIQPRLKTVPFYSRYCARDTASQEIVRRKPELLAVASFSLDDETLTEPLGITDVGSPWKQLREYGISCGEFCARETEVRVNVYSDYPSYGFGRQLVKTIMPEEMIGSGARVPLFLFL